MFKSVVQRILSAKAQRILSRFHPRIIAITGSVGKTTTKEAVALVVGQKYRIHKTAGNLNTDFGLPLTILGLSPATTPWGWMSVVAQALWYRPKSYAEVLVLEFGIDHPGDMAKLATIAPPHLVIELGVASVHLEFFANKAALIEEKALLLDFLPPDGLAIINVDNEASRAMLTRNGTWKRTSFGRDTTADIRAEMVTMSMQGLSCTVRDRSTGNSIQIDVPILGTEHVHAVLVATAVGLHLGIAPDAIAKGLSGFTLPIGRLNVIPGIHGSTLIDSTYNAEPESMHMAISTLLALPAKRRISVLGDMLELGTESDDAHRALAVLTQDIALPVFVGTRMQRAYDASPSPTKLYFPTSTEAAVALPALLQSGDLILIKGSQGARMERITKALMAHPEAASTMLVRQSDYWLRKV